jgi:nitrous oxidase accessory protein NosD
MVRLTADLIAALTEMATLRSCGQPPPGCGSIQALVDAASPEAVVEAPGGCVYRETITINKPLTLKGGPGAEIRGTTRSERTCIPKRAHTTRLRESK